jgi:hypothetical protein
LAVAGTRLAVIERVRMEDGRTEHALSLFDILSDDTLVTRPPVDFSDAGSIAGLGERFLLSARGGAEIHLVEVEPGLAPSIVSTVPAGSAVLRCATDAPLAACLTARGVLALDYSRPARPVVLGEVDLDDAPTEWLAWWPDIDLDGGIAAVSQGRLHLVALRGPAGRPAKIATIARPATSPPGPVQFGPVAIDGGRVYSPYTVYETYFQGIAVFEVRAQSR